jgi:hypothetical protein
MRPSRRPRGEEVTRETDPSDERPEPRGWHVSLPRPGIFGDGETRTRTGDTAIFR